LAMINQTDQLQILDFEKEKSKVYDVPHHDNVLHLQDSKWLLFKGKKWFIYDEASNQQIQDLNNKRNLYFFDAIKLSEDSLIIATQKNGLWLYDLKREKFLNNWKNEVGQTFTLTSDAPRELYLSESGYLFTSHRNKGVDFAYVNKSNFTNPIKQHTDKNVEITSIFESINQNIWVSTKRNGVYVFDLKGSLKYFYSYPFDDATSTELYQVIQNKKGDILGITAKAIYKFDLENKSVKNIVPKSDSISFWYMNSFFEDRDFISSTKGIIQLTKDRKGNYILQPCPELAEYREASFYQMYKTTESKLLIPLVFMKTKMMQALFGQAPQKV